MVWQPECREFRVPSCPPDSPGYSQCVPPAASCRTDVGSQQCRSITLPGAGCRPSGLSMPRPRMYALRVAQVAQRGDCDRSSGALIGGAPPIPDPPPVHTTEPGWAELGHRAHPAG